LLTPDDALIAPCVCTGTQEFVHVTCLRKWQRASQSGGYRTGHETFCSVCKAPFALPPPPLPKSAVRAGMLLIASERLAGTFKRTVILLCEVNAEGAHGVIINQPLREGESGVKQAVEDAARLRGRTAISLEWRRGGPVCGGRLGVTNYACLHTVYQPRRGRGLVRSLAIVMPTRAPAQGREGEEASAARGAGGASGAGAETGSEASAASAGGGNGDGGRGADAATDEDADLGGERGMREEGGENEDEDDEDDEGEEGEEEEEEEDEGGDGGEDGEQRVGTDAAVPDVVARPPPPPDSLAIHVTVSSGTPSSLTTRAAAQTVRKLAKVASESGQALFAEGGGGAARVMLFIGYSRWGRNQLQGEIARGSWEVCEARAEDVLRGDPALWQELRGSERVLSPSEMQPDGDDDE
jgi:putative AlgH/UPF0301 family transcriptional regulator